MKDEYKGVLIRNYEKEEKDLFYHLYTSIKTLKDPVEVTFESKSVESFKNFLRNRQNSGEVKVSESSKTLILLPKYNPDLRHDEFCVPNSMLPIFPEHSKSLNLRTYECSIRPDFSPEEVKASKKESIEYSLE